MQQWTGDAQDRCVATDDSASCSALLGEENKFLLVFFFFFFPELSKKES